MNNTQLLRLNQTLLELYDIGDGECLELADTIETFISDQFGIRSKIRTAFYEFNLIEDFINEHPTTCVYCGGMGNEKDHLLPINWTGETARSRVPTVPCCRSCNAILGDYLEPSIYLRCQYIADTLEDSRYVILRAGGAANATRES